MHLFAAADMSTFTSSPYAILRVGIGLLWLRVFFLLPLDAEKYPSVVHRIFISGHVACDGKFFRFLRLIMVTTTLYYEGQHQNRRFPGQDPAFRAIVIMIFILSVLCFCQIAEHVLHFWVLVNNSAVPIKRRMQSAES
jgi:hypothetical protein